MVNHFWRTGLCERSPISPLVSDIYRRDVSLSSALCQQHPFPLPSGPSGILIPMLFEQVTRLKFRAVSYQRVGDAREKEGQAEGGGSRFITRDLSRLPGRHRSVGVIVVPETLGAKGAATGRQRSKSSRRYHSLCASLAYLCYRS